MSRRPRIHIPQGTYYVLRPLEPDSVGSLQPEDYASIENLLPPALRHTGVRLLGYCWMPDALHFAVRVSTTPVSYLMREFTSRFVQHVHRRTGKRGTYFRARYRPMLINPEEYLPELVRYLHHLPVAAGLVHDPGDYQWSSHGAYLARARHPWLDVKPLLHCMGGGAEGKFAACRLLTEAPPAHIVELFAPNGGAMPEILGSTEFVASLANRPRAFCGRWSLAEIAQHVAQAHGVSISDLRSRSRRHELVLARARISWFVTERRVASLNEVARFLNHSASCLTRAITRCQCREPELFAPAALSALAPWMPFSGEHDERAGIGISAVDPGGHGDAPQSNRTDSEIRAADPLV